MKSTAILLAAALLVAPAAAQPVAQSPQYKGNLSGFSGNAEALPRAIMAIEAQGPRVLEIRYDGSNGPGYQAVVLRNQKVEFDRASEPIAGLTVISSGSEPTWMLGWRGREDIKAARNAKVDLARAVRTAEMQNGGAAVAAGIARSASNPTSNVKAYNVLLVSPGGALRRIAVDADTGLPIANPSALSDWP